MNRSCVFFTREYEELATDIALTNGYSIGSITHKIFPDGEHYMCIDTPVSHTHAILIGGSFCDESTLELYDLSCGLIDHGALSLTLVLPYFGYSTMERAIKPGEVVTAKNRARLFSSIPKAPYGNSIYAVDLHTGGLPHYFERGLRVFHIYAKSAIIEACQNLDTDDFVLASTDAGRAKWVESLANDMGVPAAFVFKKRLSGSRTEVQAVSANVQNKDVIIYDDMIRTGGSLIGAAQAYKNSGARNIWAICTHGVFPKGAIARLQDSNLFQQIFCTNSHPNAYAAHKQYADFVSVISLKNILSHALKQ
jgi:ribose-phosphate pyrophosphokinase